MRVDVESFLDFCQYYGGRFVKGRTPGEMFHIGDRLDGSNVHVSRYLHGRKDHDHKPMSWDAIRATMLFGLPRLGMVVHKHELVYLYYRASRHGGRGFDHNRIQMHSFNQWPLMREGLRVASRDSLHDPVFIHMALTHNHTRWEVASEALFSPALSTPAFALSYNFGVFLSDREFPSLCYRTAVIGDVVKRDKVVLYPSFAKYKDILRRWVSNDIEVVTS